MSHLIYKSSVPHVIEGCPEKPISCGGKGFCCDGRRCDVLVYNDALAESIAKAIPVVESDREIARVMVQDVYSPSEVACEEKWLPPDDVVLELDAEFEIITQKRYKGLGGNGLWMGWVIDVLEYFIEDKIDPSVPPITRQVAKLKAQTTEKKEHLPKRDASNRDWSEDYDQENGNYQNKCCFCKLLFYGNKHRVVCKQCDSLHPSSTIETKQASEGKDWSREKWSFVRQNNSKGQPIVTLLWGGFPQFDSITPFTDADLEAIASTLNGNKEIFNRLEVYADQLNTRQKELDELISVYKARLNGE